jgi:hypothetical protein
MASKIQKTTTKSREQNSSNSKVLEVTVKAAGISNEM